MLKQDQIELIQQEIDGANSPAESAALRSLMERNPEARALEAELRHVTQLFSRVGEREPPPHLKHAILEALPQPARVSPKAESIVQRFVVQLRLITEHMEEAFMTRRTMLVGGTALAIVIVIAARIAGFPPSGSGAGTIGGVEQASRYRGRTMTTADVTLQNPEIQALFQNQDVLHLVQSDVFREAMRDQTFRTLQSNEAYRTIMASDAYRQVLASDAYRHLQANDAFRDMQASEAYRQLEASEAFRQVQAQGAARDAQSSDAMRQVQASEAYRTIMANDAFREVMASDAYRQVQANEAYRQVEANEAFRTLQANDAFRTLQANEAFRTLQATDAFRTLQANDAFRAISRSPELSDQFMREAMRAAQ